MLGGPHNNVVVKHGTKQLLYESGHVMNAFEFHKEWSAEELLENIRSAFSSHLPPGAKYARLLLLILQGRYTLRCTIDVLQFSAV